ncbi:c-type cytochrome [Limimaricola hongkongensis]|uniref:Cytochrome c-554 n=1 Tax=Limimaricola hongkongensis DSM 17492 TaxID=1122180 RepID=A0A017HCM2_9RHOB|nr:cytochrome c [Limimaricola hongkongensis]EYD71913.1 cytochrome c-554 [Limimaricola hongkongensis DSM 17492]
MTRTIRLALAATGLAAIAGLASAQAFDPTRAHEVRVSHMKLMGAHIGILGGMAKGEVEYDADTAAAAADTLAALAATAGNLYWVEGSSSADLEDSRALPVIWEKMEDFNAQEDALSKAAMAMKQAAGTDLAALQGAMGALGKGCGDCHETYRKPDEE